MGVRNRETSGYRRGRRGGAWLLKSIGLMFFLALLSFALGFFVLARLLPGNQKTDNSVGNIIENAATRPDNAGNAPAASPVTPSSVGNNPGSTVPTPPSGPAPSKMQAPSIDALTDKPGSVQQPDSLDRSEHAALPADNQQDKGKNPFVNIAPNTPATDNPAAPTPPVRHRHHRDSTTTPDSNNLQTPARPDNDSSNATSPSAAPGNTDTGSTTDKAAGDTGSNTNSSPGNSQTAPSTTSSRSAASDSGLYRVQLGVYSTRETADAQAQAARDKGFRIRVQEYTSSEGRTLYRVQQGVYRHRASAEAALQRLTQAGVQAAISKP
jgi:cell division septation protein DedD